MTKAVKSALSSVLKKGHKKKGKKRRSAKKKGVVLGSGALVTGQGAYHVSNASRSFEKNALSSSQGLSSFSAGTRSTFISMREYIGDITVPWDGSFSVQTFAINPGLVNSFPFLSSIAALYEMYSFHGLVFEFRSTCSNSFSSTNPNLGVVIMNCEYNNSSSMPVNKQQMENSEEAVACKSNENMAYGVECKPNLAVSGGNLFIRQTNSFAANGPNIAQCDLGEIQVATSGLVLAAGASVSQSIGELWVSYSIELRHPKVVCNEICAQYHLWSTSNFVSSHASLTNYTIAGSSILSIWTDPLSANSNMLYIVGPVGTIMKIDVVQKQ
jgi:hypothetical protein